MRSVPLDDAARCSRRSSTHLTVTPVSIAASPTSAMYGYMLDLMPKLPPMSAGTMKRIRFSGRPSTRAVSGCMMNGPMKFDQTVSTSSIGSQRATMPYVSIGVEPYFGKRKRSRITTSASRNARSGSPYTRRRWFARFVPTASWRIGASGSSARSASTTAGSGS